ncbi:MAG: formate C-acetyltransferase [Sebaldella sp.]|nr:formate C-acetyltransferase [Sebaldella sp.]
MNKRIELLKKDLFKNKREVSIERALLYTESFKLTDGEPQIIRRAKATKNILDKVIISIRENEIIAGNRTVKPRAGIISPEMDPYWILEEIDTIHDRSQDKFIFTEEDKVTYREKLFPYWMGKSMKDSIVATIDDEIKESVNEKIVNLNQTDKGQGHIIPGFDMILDKGLGYLIEKVNEKAEKNDFYKAAKITLEAASNHILRYANLADELLETEKDEVRRKDLERISVISRKISYEKPESFLEALQLLWYMCVILQHESNASSISLGRIDQYFNKFYENDIKKGVPQKELKEFLEAFYIKTNDIVMIRSSHSAKFFAGFPVGYTALLGGLTKEGRSAVNELSYLCLEAYKDIQLPQPNLGVRVNELEPRKFMMKTCEVIRMGTGIPQIFNDEVIIPSFLSRGVELEDARNYSVVGCVELSIPGKTYGLHDIAMLNILKIMEKVLLENKTNKNITFDEILEGIGENIKKYVKLMAKGSNIVDEGHKIYAPVPLLSVTIDNCLENGLDITEGGAKYNFSGVQGIGMPNLSDSLYAIKKFVFEEKRYSFEELIDVMEKNYDTSIGEEIKLRLINDDDKYGNDLEDVDKLSSDILRLYCKEVEKYSNPRGGIFIPGSYTVSAHIPLGEVVGATPDGRMAGEQLADGGLSPMFGRDKLGPTAVLKSVSKLDNYLLTNGSLLNVKLSPGPLQSEQGLENFVNYLYAYMKLKIQHIQFNVVGRDTLKEAQMNPDKYENLVVRVAGYSAFFVELNEKIQNDIINRTEHTF